MKSNPANQKTQRYPLSYPIEIIKYQVEIKTSHADKSNYRLAATVSSLAVARELAKNAPTKLPVRIRECIYHPTTEVNKYWDGYYMTYKLMKHSIIGRRKGLTA